MKRSTVILGGPMPIGPKKNVRDEAACRVERGSNGEEVYNWRANRQMPYGISEPLIYGRQPPSTKGQPGNDKGGGYGDEI
jgi:hypothetical protein